MANLGYKRQDGMQVLSYSLLEDLEACARKFQLYNVVGAKGNEHDRRSIDFAFGHSVGSGVQAALMGCDITTCYYEAIINYSASSFIKLDERIKKQLHHALIAVREFYRIAQNIRKDYDVVTFEYGGETVIGVEPEFSIQFQSNRLYNGHIDVLMVHKETGIPKVIEIKTTVLRSVHPSVYSNSNQVKGYAMGTKFLQFKGILAKTDKVDVEYHVYKSGMGEWEPPLLLSYSHNDVIAYIKDINTKCKMIDLYESDNNYPCNGSACNNFFRACEFYNTCHWPTDRFAKGDNYSKTESNSFSVNLEEFKEYYNWLHEGQIEVTYIETPVDESVNHNDFIDLGI